MASSFSSRRSALSAIFLNDSRDPRPNSLVLALCSGDGSSGDDMAINSSRQRRVVPLLCYKDYGQSTGVICCSDNDSDCHGARRRVSNQAELTGGVGVKRVTMASRTRDHSGLVCVTSLTVSSKQKPSETRYF
jgi:hypothetical protein